ncbi:helix-turn-helix domain-containing protein [Algimonas porphyrae]|uniref:DNA-binding protein n=1 Tax=Algimonas porphyrae TaxID=1128113 RepID=A0ABQ5V1Q0_9PROT|nr:XRE family transcriptional regulator [Algimonas porphyrae]GLQ20738.1 DNA-binding protein [Algimonas porphyrae]
MQFHPDASKIKRWREERHWSQDHLADLAGIGTRTVQRIEKGEAATYESVMALAAAFNVDVVALTVDPNEQAKAEKITEASKGLAGLRLSFWIHLASYVFVMIVFLAIDLSQPGDGFTMLVPAAWCTVGISGHGLAVAIFTLVHKFNQGELAP